MNANPTPCSASKVQLLTKPSFADLRNAKFFRCVRLVGAVGIEPAASVHSHLSVNYEAREPEFRSRVIFGLELTGAVELLLFLGVLHFGIQIDLGDLERLVSKPALDFH